MIMHSQKRFNMLTEKQKYLQWFEEEKKKGLFKVHFSVVHPLPQGTTEEDIYGELNRIREAPDVLDTEL